MHVVVHGGAGSTPEAPTDRQRTLADAAEAASTAETPLDAVCAAVRPLERDPRFNAGVGGAVQSDGVVRPEAGVMTGDAEPDEASRDTVAQRAEGGTAGAAAALPGVVHAVDVAAVVARETPHLLVAGPPAVQLAADSGLDTDVDLLTDETRERYETTDVPTDRDAYLAWVREHFEGTDTVGAVATDGERVATATSTAGRWFALAGRVGDVPQLGAGFYADDRGGVSVTGEGEAIARFGLARRTVDLLDTFSPQQAVGEALAEFEDATGGQAGIVAMDPTGRVGSEFNTAAMQTARTERD